MLKIALKCCKLYAYMLFLHKNSIEMYIIEKNEPIYESDLSLSEMLSQFCNQVKRQTEISCSSPPN